MVFAAFKLIALLGLFGLYIAPAVVAILRGHTDAFEISIICLYTGWTIYGWLVAWRMAYGPIPEEDGLERGQAPALKMPVMHQSRVQRPGFG